MPPLHGSHLPEDALLVTAGGGGDGASLMHQVDRRLRARPEPRLAGRHGARPLHEGRGARRASPQGAPPIRPCHADRFRQPARSLMESAAGVVGMGGYNTFCEILSLDKRALIVPRTRPREEQLIRARRAAGLGLVDMLLPEEADDPGRMAAALHRLATRPRAVRDGLRPPARRARPHLRLVHDYMAARRRRRAVCDAAATGRAARERLRSSSSSRAIRGCPKPSSPRRFSASKQAGIDIRIVSLRRPTDGKIHPVHRAIRAPVAYLPEYLHQEPLRVLRPSGGVRRGPGFGAALAAVLRPTCAATSPAIGVRRFGQACVLAAELPADVGAAPRPFHPHAGQRRGLCGAARRPALDLFGPCQGHLDLARLGSRQKLRAAALDRDLHGGRPGAAAGAGPPAGRCGSSITA